MALTLQYHEVAADGLLRSKAGIAVLGRGLGLHPLLLEVVHRTLEEGWIDERHATRLVFLINTSHEESDILMKLADLSPPWAKTRKRITCVGPEMSVEDRAEAFTTGGVFIVSARLLVPDILTGRVVIEAVNGIIVNHAHNVGELSAEAFVLRLFRQKNKTGFIRAVSDRPECFERAHTPIDKVMQRCFLHTLEVLPRIRQEVQHSLQSCVQLEVIQKTLTLPPHVQEIQRRLMNVIEGVLDELRKNTDLSLGHLTLRDSLFQSFDTELRQALDPHWHTLGPRTRRLVHDLASVRRLLSALPRCDAVEFHETLEMVYSAEGGRDVPAWLFSEDAQALHKLSKARIYEIVPVEMSNERDGLVESKPMRLQRTLVPHAKWQVLLDIVEQIISEVTCAASNGDNRQRAASSSFETYCKELPPFRDLDPVNDTSHSAMDDDDDSDIEIVSVTHLKRARLASSADEPALDSRCDDTVLEPRVLLVVPDDLVKRQISSLLHRGIEATLLDTLRMHLRDRGGRVKPRAHPAENGTRPDVSNHTVGGVHARAFPRNPAETIKPIEAKLVAQESQCIIEELKDLVPQSILQVRRLSDGQVCHPRVDVVCADGPDGALELQLLQLRPHAVILYEPCLEGIRALEVFCALSVRQSDARSVVKKEPGAGSELDACNATHKSQLKVYLLVFDDSTEKHRYQQALLKEGVAVDALIHARSNHTIRLDEGLTATVSTAESARSTRKGGGARSLDGLIRNRIIVDMREFRSALPFMLHLRDLVVEPVTIPVGDYVLSRDICVERKAIPDLIQSLASGRLYQQAQNLCKLYANPSVLIEFDPDKSFSLQNSHTLARRDVDVSTRDLLGKLALLILHFPQLRLIWSPSQKFTADIFSNLKVGRHQPDVKAASRMSNSDDDVGELAAGDINGAPRRSGKQNAAAFDVLRKLPGVTPRNMHGLAKRAGSVAGIANLPEVELVEIMGRSNAQQLLEFFHREDNIHSVLGREQTQNEMGDQQADMSSRLDIDRVDAGDTRDGGD